jgi:hypothetical protein
MDEECNLHRERDSEASRLRGSVHGEMELYSAEQEGWRGSYVIAYDFVNTLHSAIISLKVIGMSV